MAALYSLYSYAIIYPVVLSLHHLLFGGQVYHSLLFLDLFQFSFQSVELTALVVAATAVAIYWFCWIYSVCLCLFAFALHALLHAAEPSLPTCLLRPSLALQALHPLCWALCPEMCAVQWAVLTMLTSHGASPDCISSFTFSP